MTTDRDVGRAGDAAAGDEAGFDHRQEVWQGLTASGA